MKNLQWWLMKIDRACAWTLLIGIFLFILSGYGMTKGIIDGENARWMHLTLLPVVIFVAFTGHVGLALRITFIRWRIWNKATMAILILTFGAFLAAFGYIELFYGNNYSVQNTAEVTSNIMTDKTSETKASEQNTAKTTSEKTFTAAELAKYNGLNGQPAYAAVDGVVYNLSPVFRNGYHQGHAAGKDLTEAFYSAHMKSILSKFSVVGKLAE